MGKLKSTASKNGEKSDSEQSQDLSASVREESTSYLQSNVPQTQYAGITSHRLTVSDGILVVPGTGPQIPSIPLAALVRIPSQTNTLSPYIRLSLVTNTKYSPLGITTSEMPMDGKAEMCAPQKSDSAYFSKSTPQADTKDTESGYDDEDENIARYQEDVQVQQPSKNGFSVPINSIPEEPNTMRARVSPNQANPSTKSVRLSPVPVIWHDTGQPDTAPDTSTATITPRYLLESSTLKDRQTNGAPIFPPVTSPSTQTSQDSVSKANHSSHNLTSSGEPLPAVVSHSLDPMYEEARQETPWDRMELASECDSQDETREVDRIYHGYKVKFFTELVDNDPSTNTSQLLSPPETLSETHFTPQSFSYVQTVPSQASHSMSVHLLENKPFRSHSKGLSIGLESGYATHNTLQEINT